jgi:hypothetical protein
VPRSAGITVSAVLVIIGSVLTIIFGAVMALGSTVISHSGTTPGVPFNLSHVLVTEAIVVFGFGIWGLASGIGLLNTKQWARISLLIYAVLLVLMSLPAALMIAIVPLPATNNPNLSSSFMLILRYGMLFFYSAIAALGGFWLYFFNTKNVKAEFRGQAAVQSAQGLPLGLPVAAQSGSDGGRPVSITIIGWFLLVGAACMPLMLLLFRVFLPGVHLPLFFLGFFFLGRSASIILVVWMAVQLVVAIGLLKLKNWGRLGALGLQCLGFANTALLLAIPANRATSATHGNNDGDDEPGNVPAGSICVPDVGRIREFAANFHRDFVVSDYGEESIYY